MSEEIEQKSLAAALGRGSDVQIAEDREERMHKRSGDPERDEIPLPDFTEVDVPHEELADPSDYVGEIDALVAPVPADRLRRERRPGRGLAVIRRECNVAITRDQGESVRQRHRIHQASVAAYILRGAALDRTLGLVERPIERQVVDGHR